MHVFVYACMLYLFTSELVPITPDSVRTWALIHAPLMYPYSCTRIFVCSAREYLHEKKQKYVNARRVWPASYVYSRVRECMFSSSVEKCRR